MPDFRRGMEGLNAPQESKGGSFSPFVPNITWKDGDEKYIAFLNPVEDIPTVQLHEWIEVGRRDNGKPIFEWFLSRKTAGLDEDYDDIEDRLGIKAKDRTIAIAVELEPSFSMVNGRKRPTGFQVKTETFERRVEGGGTEEVVAPVIGFVMQSRFNFFGWVGTFNEAEDGAPIEDTPLKVKRRGGDQNTQYDFTPYIDQEIDYSNLIDFINNVSYVRDMEPIGEGKEAALSIGAALLDKRLDELADKERYDRLVGGITHLDNKFGGKERPRSSNGNGNGQPSPAPVGDGNALSKLRAAVAAKEQG